MMIPLFSGLTSSLELGLPEEVCQNVSEIEVRFRDYYPYFLSREVYDNNSTHFGKVSHNLGGHQNGLVAKIIIESAKSCCDNVSVSFASLGDDDASYPIAFIVQSEVLRSSHHHSSVDPKKLIFYFPEFSGKGATQVYEYPRAFLPVLKSPGHAVVMLSSDAKFGLKAIEVLGPSLPLLGLMFIAALVFGVVIWFLERWNNADEFPRLFFRGSFEGFWWAVVTMTTVGYGDKAPKSFSARLLSIIWMFTSYILLSLMVANTTSIIATQHLQNIQRTIGLRIGTHNSKDFVEREMNLGAEIIDFNNSQKMAEALLDNDIDRFLFPHYIHFLMVATKFNTFQENLYVAKVLDQPFQLGLVLAHPTSLKAIHGHEYFYFCLNSFVQRQAQMFLNYSEIKTRKDITPSLMNISLVTKTSTLLIFIVSGFIILGILWDLWTFCKKPKSNAS